MKDQAVRLRELASSMKSQIEHELWTERRLTRVIVVSSGKGGVGKSTFSLNLGLALAGSGQRVVLVDADLGMANIDVMLGMIPQYNLYHMMRGEKGLREIIVRGPMGMDIIPGGSGIAELANMRDDELKRILIEMGKIDGDYDFMIVDTGAGISDNVLQFVLAGDDVVVVTTPEPTSLTDAYGLIKNVARDGYQGQIYIVVNKVGRASEGEVVGQKLQLVSEKFLGLDLVLLGHIMQDSAVEQVIKEQKALLQEHPRSEASRNIAAIAARLSGGSPDSPEELPAAGGGIRGFFKKMSIFGRA